MNQSMGVSENSGHFGVPLFSETPESINLSALTGRSREASSLDFYRWDLATGWWSSCVGDRGVLGEDDDYS